MSTFETQSDGRISVHVLPNTRFRTRDLTIRLHIPLSRQHVTAYALLPFMWMNGTKARPSNRDLMIAADDLYGAVLRTSTGKKGDYRVLEAAVGIPDIHSVSDEDISQQAIQLLLDLIIDHAPHYGAFNDDYVQQELGLHRRRIEAARDDKMSFALERCLAEVAQGAPAALPRLGYLDDLPIMTPDKLYQAYEVLLEEAEIDAYLVGHFEAADEISKSVFEAFSSMLPQRKGNRSFHVEALPRDERGETPADFQVIRETQDVAQAQLDIGYRTGVNFAHDSYAQLVMMNGILGGFTHSKLFANVREKHSLAYTVWSHIDAMTGVLAVMTGIAPENYEKTLGIIRAQVAEMADGNICYEEMEFARRSLTNQYTVLQDQPSALANWHYNGRMSGRDRDIQELIAEVEQVTKDNVAQMAQLLEPHTLYFLTREGDAS